MPSALHETVVDLFRRRATLAPALVCEAAGIPLPSFSSVTIDESNAGTVPAFDADLVLVLRDEDRAAHGLVVEAQLTVDPNKRFSWPVYAVTQRARLKCPVSVVVLATNARVARWAAEAIHLGEPDNVFRPIVLGPSSVPWVSSYEQAREAPELALLSALAHGNEEGGIDVVLAAVAGAHTLDDERKSLYLDGLMASLKATVIREFEAMTRPDKLEFESEYMRRLAEKAKAEVLARAHEQGLAAGREQGLADGREQGLADGVTEGRAAMLLRLIERRGWHLDDAARARIEASRDIHELERWFDRALEVTSAEAIFDDA